MGTKKRTLEQQMKVVIGILERDKKKALMYMSNETDIATRHFLEGQANAYSQAISCIGIALRSPALIKEENG